MRVRAVLRAATAVLVLLVAPPSGVPERCSAWAEIAPAPGPPTPVDPGRAAFPLRQGEVPVLRRLALATVLPGESLEVLVPEEEQDSSTRRAADGADDGPGALPERFRLHASGGAVIEEGPRRWVWRAPESSGPCEVRVVREADATTVTLQIFVLVPLESVKDGWLNGYRIGRYPTGLAKILPIYTPPRGFIEVTPANIDTRISPHFTLGQFLCKQEADWPRYLVLRPRLVQKLEHILEVTNAAGHRCDSFAVLSGYRTPWYNETIGNVKYSRHLYGGAADIYIDENPRDGEMDDLDGDGTVNIADAAVLYAIVDELYGRPWYARFVGGLGQYRRTALHGPFVHVDVRGTRARWGH